MVIYTYIEYVFLIASHEFIPAFTLILRLIAGSFIPSFIRSFIHINFSFSLQIESIDDPVPAVEAILRRCNKQQVIIISFSQKHCLAILGKTS